MTILLYRYTGDPTRVYKTDLLDPDYTIELEGDLREESFATDPVITITTDKNLSFYNYAYVDYFARWYFARFEIVRTGVWRAYLHVDVVSCAGYYFAEDVVEQNIKAVLARTENPDHWDLALADPEYPIDGTENIILVRNRSVAATTGFTNMTTANRNTGVFFVLTVAGTQSMTYPPPVSGTDGVTVNSGIFTKSYLMTEASVYKLSKYLNETSNFWDSISTLFSGSTETVLSALISLKWFPIEFSAYHVSDTFKPIMIANIPIPTTTSSPGINDLMGMQISRDYPIRHFLGAWHIPEQYSGTTTFIDLNATEISVYLPFIGIKELAPEDVIGKDISIIYDIDPISGNAICTLAVYRVPESLMERPLYQFPCNVGVDIPMTTTNAMSTAINRLSGGVTSGVSALAGDYVGAVSGVLLNNWRNQATTRVHGPAGDAIAYNYGLDPYFIIRRTRSVSPDRKSVV